MSVESDQAKLDAFADSFKSNLLDASSPIEVSKETSETPEEKALDSFETAQPLREKISASHPLSSEEAQEEQERADQKRYRRGIRRPLNADPIVHELATVNEALNQRIEYNNQFYQNELARLKREAEENARKARNIEEHNLKVKEEYLLNALIQAKEAGDYETEAKIQRSLSAIHADLSTADLRQQAKASFDEPYYQRYNPPPPPVIQQPAPVREEYLSWLEQNPWFSPDSPDYNPDLAEEVMGYARDLNKHLQIRGMGDQIDSAGYYDVLNKIIKDKYSLEEDPEAQDPAPRPSSSIVAPVHRSATTPSNRVSINGKSPVYLDADQREIALARKKTHPDGTPYTPHELLQYHAQLVSRLEDHDKAYGIKPSHYKTTLRFG